MDKLEQKWILWYHSINDNNWGKNSYQKIYELNTIYDFQYIKDIFKQDHYQNGMFFCMKDDIFPNWEDPENRSGGCLSFNIVKIWFKDSKFNYQESFFEKEGSLISLSNSLYKKHEI